MDPKPVVVSANPQSPNEWREVSSGDEYVWACAPSVVKSATTYYCRAAVKDPAIQVRFRFRAAAGKNGETVADLVCPLDFSDWPLSANNFNAETVVILDEHNWKELVVEVQAPAKVFAQLKAETEARSKRRNIKMPAPVFAVLRDVAVMQ